MKILFVDDDEHVRWLTQTVLESLGHQVTAMDNAQEALEAITLNPQSHDCLLVDRNMPGMSGLDLLRSIRGIEGLRDKPVIMLTSLTSPEEVAEGLAEGAQLYLSKPAPKKLLKAALSQIAISLEERREIKNHISETQSGLSLAETMTFRLKTLDQARQLSALLATLSGDAERTAVGFAELLINAIEHGNLNISYQEKSKLLESDALRDDIKRRMEDPIYGKRSVFVRAWKVQGGLKVRIEDEGEGFDWRPFMDFDPERAFDLHGRGIAISNKMAFDELAYIGRGNVVEVYVQATANAPLNQELEKSA